MQAMVLRAAGAPLEPSEMPLPSPAADQVLLRVECCAVCRTDLHVVDGELRDPKLPLIPRSSDRRDRRVDEHPPRRSLARLVDMSDIPSFPYELLWNERTIRSVASLTRADG